MRWAPILLTLFPLSAEAVRLTAGFSSKKDTATCDWNTTRGTIRAPQASNGQTLNFGNGSNGDCNFSGTVAAGTYNCRNLTVSGNARFTGATAVVIRVQGNATISGTLSVEGFAGTNGDESFPSGGRILAGGNPGPAGFAGGNFDSNNFPFSSAAGSQNTTGAGDPAADPSGTPTNFAGGGGGGGGSFGDSTLGSAGSDGTANGAATPGTGGVTSAPETAAAEDGFETLLIGGAGGGAGSLGDEDLSTTWHEPGTGGGGGGALHLVVAGNINVTGTISANGGRGGNALNLGGGGGGGAGGSIWLQAGGHITNNGTIRALGGAGGTVTTNAPFAPITGGNGGAGGVGRIRLDDFDGVLSGNATTPVAQTAASTPGVYDVGFDTAACTALTQGFDTIGKLNRFREASAVQALNGGTLTVNVQESDDGAAWSASVPLNQIDQLNQRYLRFDISLTPASAATSPELDAITVDYDVIEKSTKQFTSDVSCGTVDMDGGSGGPLTLLLGLFTALAALKRKRKV